MVRISPQSIIPWARTKSNTSEKLDPDPCENISVDLEASRGKEITYTIPDETCSILSHLDGRERLLAGF